MVTWYKSDDRYDGISVVRFDICPLILFRRQKKRENAPTKLSIALLKPKIKNNFAEATEGEIKKLVENSVPRNTKKSTKYSRRI